MKHHVSICEMTRMKQNLRLAALYLKMNDEGRDALDMVIQILSEINRESDAAKYKDGSIYEDIERKK